MDDEDDFDPDDKDDLDDDDDEDDDDLDDMIRAVWEETRETDCSKLAEIIVTRMTEQVIREILTDLIGNQCFALLTAEGQPVHRLDPRFEEALAALGESGK